MKITWLHLHMFLYHYTNMHVYLTPGDIHMGKDMVLSSNSIIDTCISAQVTKPSANMYCLQIPSILTTTINKLGLNFAPAPSKLSLTGTMAAVESGSRRLSP